MLDLLITTKQMIENLLTGLVGVNNFALMAHTSEAALDSGNGRTKTCSCGQVYFGGNLKYCKVCKAELKQEIVSSNMKQIYKKILMTVELGGEYKERKNEILKAAGLPEVTTVEKTYCSDIADNGVLYKHEERDTYYLRVYPELCKTYSYIVLYYDADNKRISTEQYKAWRKEFSKKGDKKLNPLAVMIRNYELENVKFLINHDTKQILINKVTDSDLAEFKS